MQYVKMIVSALVLLFLVTFGVKNSQPVELTYYFEPFRGSLPLYALVYLSTAVGLVIGLLLGFFKRLRLSRVVRRFEKRQAEAGPGQAEKSGALVSS